MHRTTALPICAVVLCGDSGIVTRFVAVMVSPFATRTVGPFFTVVTLSQYCLEDG